MSAYHQQVAPPRRPETRNCDLNISIITPSHSQIEELKAENGDAPLIPKGTGTMALAMRRRAKEAKVGAKRGGKRARVVEEEQGEGAGVAVGTRSGAGRSRRQRVVA